MALLQSRQGFLWIGTGAGLARFDGIRFTVFDRSNTPILAADLVQALAEDRHGTVWFGTGGGGLYRYDARDGVRRAADPARVLGKRIYTLCADRDGRVWVGSEKGLHVAEADTVRTIERADGFPQVPVYSIAQADDGAIWFATYGAGVGRYAAGKIDSWQAAQGLVDDRAILVATAVGRVWAGTYDGSLQALLPDGRFGPSVTSPAPSTAKGNRGLWALAAVPHGLAVPAGQDEIWVGSFAGGLGRLENGRIRFQTGAAAPGAVWALLADREGNLWVGSSEGLYQYRRQPVTVYTDQDGLPGRLISSVWQDGSGTVWVGTTNGLVRWQTAQGQRRRQFVSRAEVTAKAEDAQGDLWLGTANQGLLRLRAGGMHPTSVSGPWRNQPIRVVLVDRQQGLWVGTFPQGLYHCATVPRAGAAACSPVPEINGVTALLQTRDGTIWAGTRQGLAERTGGSWRYHTVRDGLPADHIKCLHEDADGALWIGTEGGGLARRSRGQYTVAARAEGLFDNSIYSILEEQGRLWLGSSKGIFSIRKADFPGSRERPLNTVSYGLLDGLATTQMSPDTPNAAVRTSSGELWFASMRGVARIIPDRLPPPPGPPRVVVDEARLDGEVVPPGESIVAPIGTRHIEISLAALGLTVPEKQVIRYRLRGYDERWIDAGARRLLSYTNLAAGTYTLEAAASNGDGLWSTPTTLLAVTVEPHLYQRRWFQVALGSAILVLLWALVQWRLRAVRNELQLVVAERTRIAGEIHDTYLQGFTGIALQLQSLQRRIPHSLPEVRDTLATLLVQADSCLIEARQSIWDMRDGQGAPERFCQAAAALAELLVRHHGVRLQCTIADDPLPTTDPVSQALLRILREAVANALQHGKPQTLWVRAEREGGRLVLEVEDDGCGFAPDGAVPMGHFGLVGIRERAARLGGHCAISSRPGQGTRLRVTLPLGAGRDSAPARRASPARKG